MISNLKTKKIILFFLSLFCFFLTHTVGFAKPVTVDTAMQVAANWMLQQTEIEHQALDSIILFEDGAQDRVTPYYIFNMDPGGWVIVSGDDIAYPIIGYAVQGAVDAEDVPPAFSEWMAQIEEQITEAVKNDLEPLAETETAWESLIYADYELDEASYGAVSPLIQTTWSQGKYYNTSCPADSAGPDGHVQVGCCAVAIGQVMKYHNWPVTGTGSHSYYHSTYGTLSANFGATTYNWSGMPASGQVTSYNTAVATLLYHVGVSIDMNYGPYSSGCSASKIATGFGTYFKYKPVIHENRSSYSASAWLGKLTTNLNASRPIVYTGYGSGGHAFVCDGYTGTNYFHFNWGWNGSYDGYFYLNDLTPGSHNYNNSQGAIFGIEPAGTTASAQVTSLWPVPNTSPGDTATLWARVKNTGTSSFPSNTRVWFWVTGPGWSGSHWVGSADVSGQAVGSTYWRSYHWSVPSGATPGKYTYWARVYVGSTTAISDWCGPEEFSIGPPPAATLVSPSGTICDTTPTYTWNAVSNATWYYLWVNGPSGNVFKQWYTSASVCSGSTCSVTPSKTLADGAHTWWILTWNPYGYGPWSYGKNFKIGPPLAATLVSPSRTTSDTTPTYTWNAVSNATWYYLWVNGPSGNVIKQWYTASSVTSGSTCSVTPSTTLAEGAHTWWIQTWNPCGYGPWSGGKNFTVIPGGFNSQFTGDATGWGAHSGTWWIASNAYYTTQGLAGTSSSVSYADTFSNFDYQVRLWRNGSDTNANRIIIRGTPNPLWSTNTWYSGYYFQYSRGGSCSVWKVVSGTTICLQSWTSTSAINQGSAWNTLRVVANGTNLYFYINGTLVWSGSDSSLTSGRVGFGMYSSSSGNQLWADWATLTEGSTTIIDTVSDEQQALNEEANKHRVGSENVSE